MEKSHESWTDWQLAANDPLLKAMYSQKPQGAALEDSGQMKIQSSGYWDTPAPPPQQFPETQRDEDAPTRLDSATLDAIEIIYEKLVQVRERSRSNRRKMTEVTKKKDEQIEELALKCARQEEELRSRTEELAMVDDGLQKIMKITERVDQKITEREDNDVLGVLNALETHSSELNELKRAFKNYRGAAAEHIGMLNNEIKFRDGGLTHAIAINQGLESQLLQVRDALTQQAILNSRLEAESHAIKLKVKRLESGEKTPNITGQCFKELRRDTDKQIKDLKEQHSEKVETVEGEWRNHVRTLRKDLEVAKKQNADMISTIEKHGESKLRNIKAVQKQLQKQDEKIREQDENLKSKSDLLEEQQMDLEKAAEALKEAVLLPDSTAPEAEIDALNDKLLERDLHIEKLDKYIDTIEKGKAKDTKEDDERTSQTVMDREKAEERAREWRKVPLDKRLDEARKSIIAEDCFLKCLLLGKE